MQLTFVQLRVFTADFVDLGLRDEDLRALEAELLDRPDAGRTISGTGGLRKIRFAPRSWRRGKSGATRVCYAWFPEADAIYFFTIYTKQEMDNLSAADKAYYRKVMESYRRWLRGHRGVLP
jgi:hypothetical protein